MKTGERPEAAGKSIQAESLGKVDEDETPRAEVSQSANDENEALLPEESNPDSLKNADLATSVSSIPRDPDGNPLSGDKPTSKRHLNNKVPSRHLSVASTSSSIGELGTEPNDDKNQPIISIPNSMPPQLGITMPEERNTRQPTLNRQMYNSRRNTKEKSFSRLAPTRTFSHAGFRQHSHNSQMDA